LQRIEFSKELMNQAMKGVHQVGRQIGVAGETKKRKKVCVKKKQGEDG
jgi:hypothetical protein